MSDLYTSFETSLRLKEAGAPQDHVGTRHWCPESKTLEFHYNCYMSPSLPGDEHPCAFRADEIIDAIGDSLYCLERTRKGGRAPVYVAWIYGPMAICKKIEGKAAVEALAAAWIAVLGAK